LQNRLDVAHTSALRGHAKGTEGSNLNLRQQVLAAEKFRRSLPRNPQNMPSFRNIVFPNRTAENGLPATEGGTVLAFLWRAHAQSGFNDHISERNAITKR
jgi:hypothetical protein